jgi:hypothetical protein
VPGVSKFQASQCGKWLERASPAVRRGSALARDLQREPMTMQASSFELSASALVELPAMLAVHAAPALIGGCLGARGAPAPPALVAGSIRAFECPNCAIGKKAWFEVGTEQFGFNLLATLAPLVVVVAISALVEAVTRHAFTRKQPAASDERARP